MSRPSVLSRNRPHRETRTERNWRETHDRIIRGALTEMAIHGIAGATIRGIANRANVATGTFYNHFADVDALLDEVMVDLVVMTDEFEGLLRDGEDAAFVAGAGFGQMIAFAAIDRSMASVYGQLVRAGRIGTPEGESVENVLSRQRAIGVETPDAEAATRLLGTAIAATLEYATAKGTIPTDEEIAYYVRVLCSAVCFTEEQIERATKVATAEFETFVER